ncbi:hypothetical protein ACF0H5_008711 [Mactra antiquata]
MVDGSQVLHVPGTRDSRQLYMVDGSQVLHVPGTRDSRQLYMVDGSQVLHVPGTRDKYSEHAEAYNFAQQTGSFEVKDIGGGHGKVMRQMVKRIPVYWCGAEKLGMATNYIGSHKWKDIYVEVDARLGIENTTDGYFIAARVNSGGCWLIDSTGIFFHVYPQSQRYVVSDNIAQADILKLGSTGEIEASGWNNLKLLVKGKYATGSLNDNILFNVTLPTFKTQGFAGLGTSSWGMADFDNFKLKESQEGEIIFNRLKSKIRGDDIGVNRKFEEELIKRIKISDQP